MTSEGKGARERGTSAYCGGWDAPIPILECLETAGVNPAQRGVAEAAPVCREEQNLLLVYLTQMIASCLLSTCVPLRQKP